MVATICASRHNKEKTVKKLIIALLALVAACGSDPTLEYDAGRPDAGAADATVPDAGVADATPDAMPMLCHHKTKGVLIGDSIVQDLYLAARTEMQADGDVLYKVAVAGATVHDQYLTWFTSTLRGQADIDWIYIQIGINDDLHGQDSVSVVAQNMSELIHDIQMVNPNAIIFFATMDPAKAKLDMVSLSGGPDRYQYWKDLNAKYLAMQARDDLSQGLNNGSDYLALNYDGGDGLHPNTAGDLASAAVLQSWIDERFPDILCKE